MDDKTQQEIAAIAPKVGGSAMAFIPKTPEEIKWTVGMIVGSELVPDTYIDRRTNKPDQKKMAIAILKGLEVGVPPLTAINNIAIINGRPSIWGDLAVALVQRQNLVDAIESEEIGTLPKPGDTPDKFDDSYGIEYRMKRKGTEGMYSAKFTVGMAKRAKLWMNPKKAPWCLYPDRMLLNRARAFVLRDGFSDCLAGLAIREEAEDIPAEKTIEHTDKSFLNDDPEDLFSLVHNGVEHMLGRAAFVNMALDAIADQETKEDLVAFWNANEDQIAMLGDAREDEDRKRVSQAYNDAKAALAELEPAAAE